MKKDELKKVIKGEIFHADEKDPPVYSDVIEGNIIYKDEEKMAKVLYHPTHLNINEKGEKKGKGKNYVTWIFSEETKKKENIFSTNIDNFLKSDLDPNASIGLHYHHDTEEIYYIIKGELKMTTIDQNGNELSKLLKAGDAHAILLNQGHYGTAGSKGVTFLSLAIKK